MKLVKRMLSLTLAIVFALIGYINIAYANETVTIYRNNNGQSNSPVFLTTSEWVAMCVDAMVQSPIGSGQRKSFNLGDTSIVNNEMIRKVLYYAVTKEGEAQFNLAASKDVDSWRWTGSQNPWAYGGYGQMESLEKFDGSGIYGVASNSNLGTNVDQKTYRYHMAHFTVSDIRGNNEYFLSAVESMKRIINSLPNTPKEFEVRFVANTLLGGTAGEQNKMIWKVINDVNLSLRKVSSNPDLTNFDTTYYSLENAEYGVYKTRKDALNNTNILNKLITHANGNTNTIKVKPKTDYFVKELKASKGFKLDPQIYTISVKESDISFTVKEEPILYPRISLRKVSSNPDLTNLNKEYYSLENAEYGVYKTKIDALNNKNIVGKLITHANGNTNTIRVNSYTDYFAKELKASKGFKLDSQIYTISVKDKDVSFTVKEEPKLDPLNLMLEKSGYKGEKLQNAEFEVKYYSEIVDNVDNLTPVRKWVFKTNENGGFLFRDNYKIDGDELFKDNKGTPVGLIGTYTFKEIKAPEGYLLDDTVYYAHVKDNNQVTQVNQTGTVYNRPKVVNYEVPEMKTKAVTGLKDEKKLNPISNVTITDIVEYKKLIVGKEYTVKGVLMDKLTNSPLLDEKGNKIVGEKTFIAEKEEGKVEINFTLNAKLLRGKETVVFEDLYQDNKLVSTHANIEDKDQTVKTTDPKIKTVFSTTTTNLKEVNPTSKVKLTDIVKYENLVKGESYKLELKIMDKLTNKPLLDKENKELTFTKEFIAENENGEVNVDVEVDLTKLKGKELVAFEELTYKGEIIAEHKDINDKDQTIKVVEPKIGTRFFETTTNLKEVNPTSKVKLTDIVKYENLVKGESYKLELKIMDKLTNKPLLDKENKELTFTKEFIAENENGEVNVDVEVDLTKLKGKELVAFEELTYKGEIIAEHKDINDKDQTVKITDPKIKTLATSEDKKEVIGGRLIKIKDVIKYENLILNKEYTIKAWLMDKNTNKKIEESLVETKFTPEKQNGETQIELQFDTKKMRKDIDVVVFEEIYYENELITEHKDINDKDQTVKIKTPPYNPPTGDSGIILSVITLIVSSIILSVVFARRKKAKK